MVAIRKTHRPAAFDRALQKEFELVIREAKRRAAEIQQPSDLWNLEGSAEPLLAMIT
jgi:hypothetical protein